ncbi:YpjP family protein [Halobacillus sp. ACCC02827]|uniref:YpjP family protein n=1 Tax=Halobacillus sp. ACCC02827 TaxID=3052090 RepID=UPI002570B071|nr:YpjP family protein [Halobacillus sp. ACCC02827]WJE14809.1 YpjP family protein [Halobacillus sp. ACCC02827]
MKPLMKRIFVVLISVMTLGMYVPPIHIDADAAEKKHIGGEGSIKEQSGLLSEEELDLDAPPFEAQTSEQRIQQLTESAKSQTVIKMGPRIIEKVDADMTSEILPKIEEVVTDLLVNAGDEEVPYLEITEEPTAGYGEKIFNVYNQRTKEEIARFHVRRDKRPGEGYWFNFHYHLKDDQFVKHHQIGEVFWEKNTPPKWMS